MSRRFRIPARRRGYLRTGGQYGRYLGNGGLRGITEKKFNDTFVSTTPAPGGTINSTMLVIPQGTGEQERIGNKIVVTQIHMRGVFRYQNTTSTDYAASGALNLRLLLVLDKQANGVIPNAGDILFSISSGPTFAFNRISNKDRFVVLKDIRKTLVGNYTIGGVPAATQEDFECHIKCRLPIMYGGTTGNYNEMKSNSLLVVSLAEFANQTPNISWAARVRFIDS